MTHTPAKESPTDALSAHALFRLAPYVASAEEISAARKHWKQMGWRALPAEDVERVLAEIADATTITPARVRSLALYPDERVPLELHRLRGRLLEAGTLDILRSLLLARGINDVRERGTLWNPILEAISRSHDWTSYTFPKGEMRKLFPELTAGITPFLALRKLQQQWEIALLKEKEEGQDTLLEVMSQSRSKMVMEWVVSRATTIPPEIEQRAFRDTEVFSLILSSPTLSVEAKGRLAAKVESGLRGQGGVKEEPMLPMLASILVDKKVWEVSNATALLFPIAERMKAEDSRSSPQSRMANAARRALFRLAPIMDEAQCRRLHPLIGDDLTAINSLIRNVRTPLETLRTIAREYRDVHTRTVLAQTPRAVSDPEVGILLLESSSMFVQRHVLEHGTGPAYRRLIQERLKKNVVEGLAQIRRRANDKAAMDSLQTSDLKEAFGHPEPSVRVAAIGVMGMLRPPKARGGR